LVCLHNKWYGWIPTNLGYINFDFIDTKSIERNYPKFTYIYDEKTNTKHISLKEIQLLSDSSYYSRLYNKIINDKKEHFADVEIKLTKKKDSIVGTIDLSYKNSIKYLVIFNIKTDGKTRFKFTNIDNIDKKFQINNLKTIKQSIFVILKSIVHGDNHRQKIDTAIKITHKSFKPQKILNSMLAHIKLIERNVKFLKGCKTKLYQNISIDDVAGYISYMNTFVLLFKIKDSDNNIKIAHNIKDNLQSTINKREKKESLAIHFKATALTITALFIATNIVLNPFCKIEKYSLLQFFHMEFDRFDMFIFVAFVWSMVYYVGIRCDLTSYMYGGNDIKYKLFKFFKFNFFKPKGIIALLFISLGIYLSFDLISQILRGLLF